MRCIPLNRLLKFVRGSLPAEETEAVYDHLRTGCRDCHAALERIKKQSAVTDSQDIEPSPRVLSLLDERGTGALTDRPKRIPAVLIVDSGAEGRLLGFRGAGPASRHLLYRAGNYDIDLSIDYVEQTQSTSIIGQSMPLDADLNTVAEGEVQLLKGSQVNSVTRMNEFGEFILDGVRPDVYDLRLKLKDEEVEIIGLTVSTG